MATNNTFKVFHCQDFSVNTIEFSDIERLARYIFPRQYFGDYFTIRCLETHNSSTFYCDDVKESLNDIKEFLEELTK